MTLYQTKTLKNTKSLLETSSDYKCEFCNRSFRKETTMIKHLCESKRRYQDKDLPGNRIAFQCWIEFYKKNTGTKKPKTYLDFTKSAYYTAFVKFGNYCIDVKCLNVNRYMDYLLNNKVSIDNWCSDTSYTRYLVEYIRLEDPLDAVARSIETTIEDSQKENIQSKDYLRYGNKNKICHYVTTGKISPWMLYQSESGIKFLETLNEYETKYIIDYIDPEKWAVKFKRDSKTVNEIKELLKKAGY